MSTNKAELLKVNGYGDISAKHEAENNSHIVCFTSILYTLQEDM